MKMLNKNFFRILIGSLNSILISCIIFLFFAIILINTNISENSISPVIIIVEIVSILIGSFISSKQIKKNGILNGALVGGIYIGILYLISSIFVVGVKLDMRSLIIIASSILCGIFGGIIGVNIHK